MANSSPHGNIPVRAKSLSGHAGAVAVGRFVAPVAGKALSRGGPIMTGILSQWAAISGPALAAYTLPARLVRAAPEPDFPEKTAASLLHLKVDPAKALEVQYAIPQIVERINQALGYKAVEGIRVIQAPIVNRTEAARRNARIAAQPPAGNDKASRLEKALARMAAGVKSRD